MARAYSQDLRERVVDAADGGLSARQAAERFGVGVSTAIVWVRRARTGERTARRQGQPKGSKLDICADYLLGLIATTPHISLKETQARLAEEKGVSAGIGTLWRFFAARAITFKKTAHAAEQDRADVVAAREGWFAGHFDLPPPLLGFFDETGLSPKVPPLGGRCPRGGGLRSGARPMCGRPLRCKKNLWTGAARDRVLPCVRPLLRRLTWPRARMGVRGSGPHHWNALEAPPVRLVLLTPPHRRCAIPVLRPPHTVDSLTPADRLCGHGTAGAR